MISGVWELREHRRDSCVRRSGLLKGLENFERVAVCLFGLLVLTANFAHATDDGLATSLETTNNGGSDAAPADPFVGAPEKSKPYAPLFHSADGTSPTPEESFERTEAVLDYFGVPRPKNVQSELDPMAYGQTWDGLKKLTQILNPGGDWRNYVMSPDGAPTLEVAQDRTSRSLLDFRVPMAGDAGSRAISPLAKRLIDARSRANDGGSLPLAGLRIAIDPGHMGGAEWDQYTGKFVKDSLGRKLSEGVIALQTSLLLERELKALGAEVYLTRRTIGPVAQTTRENYDLRKWARIRLSESTQSDWFLNLLASRPRGASPDSTLFEAFERSPQLQALFSEKRRTNNFILGEDLQARVDTIESFAPDLVLIVHYDVVPPSSRNPNGVNKKGYNRTKAYVPGALRKTELASRDDRVQFAQQALDPDSWQASVQLSRSLVGEINRQLGIGFDPQSPGGNIPIEPGVYSRALVLNRKISRTALSYLEVNFYNDATEFKKLVSPKNPLTIGGENVPYADRTAEIARTLRDGVLRFVRNYQR